MYNENQTFILDQEAANVAGEMPQDSWKHIYFLCSVLLLYQAVDQMIRHQHQKVNKLLVILLYQHILKIETVIA